MARKRLAKNHRHLPKCRMFHIEFGAAVLFVGLIAIAGDLGLGRRVDPVGYLIALLGIYIAWRGRCPGCG